MGTQNEEITVKFGADTGPMDSALRKMKSSVTEAGEHGHKSFVHMGSAAKAFHKILHEVTAQSPLMGGALSLAISPVTAAFAIAAVAVEKVTEHISEMNTEMSKIGRESAQPVSNVKENMREAKKSVEELRREFEKYLVTLKKDSTVEGLHGTVAEIAAKGKIAGDAATAAGHPKEAAEIEKQSLKAQFEIQAKTLREVSEKKLKTADEIDQFQKSMEERAGKTTIKNAEQANRAEEKLQARAEAKMDKIEEDKLKGPNYKDFWNNGPAANEMFDREKDKLMDAQREIIKSSKARMEKNGEAIDKETERRKELADKLAEAKSKMGEQKGIFDTVSNSLEETRSKLAGIKEPEDLRPQTAKDAEREVKAIQKRYNKYQADQQQAIGDWNKSQGIAPMGNFKDALGVTHSKKENPVTLQDLLQYLQRTLEGAGIIVRPKD